VGELREKLVRLATAELRQAKLDAWVAFAAVNDQGQILGRDVEVAGDGRKIFPARRDQL
jgi:hypothetical protein